MQQSEYYDFFATANWSGKNERDASKEEGKMAAAEMKVTHLGADLPILSNTTPSVAYGDQDEHGDGDKDANSDEHGDGDKDSNSDKDGDGGNGVNGLPIAQTSDAQPRTTSCYLLTTLL